MLTPEKALWEEHIRIQPFWEEISMLTLQNALLETVRRIKL